MATRASPAPLPAALPVADDALVAQRLASLAVSEAAAEAALEPAPATAVSLAAAPDAPRAADESALFQSLPMDTLLYILSFLGPRDAVAFSTVSWRGAEIALDEALWRSFTLRGGASGAAQSGSSAAAAAADLFEAPVRTFTPSDDSWRAEFCARRDSARRSRAFQRQLMQGLAGRLPDPPARFAPRFR
jgi:uncharacterized protein involved in copper resistance